MLKFEYTEVMNIEGSLRGARNPLKSWDKSDSGYGCMNKPDCEMTCFVGCPSYYGDFFIGENDMQLAQTLVRAGSSHRKFIRQIFVSVDITAPLYWWKQFDQYKIGVVTNSESTMHTVHKKEFELDDFSHKHLSDFSLQIVLDKTIEALNYYREQYLLRKEKFDWWQMIQLLPSSYNQKRTCSFDYENLRNMYHDRKNHKLDEWHDFCDWILSLPYSELITMEGR